MAQTPSTQMPSTDAERALDAFRTVFREIHARAASEWLSVDLSMAQLKALVWLARESGCTVSHLAETLHIGKPAASLLIDGLVHRGYVVRVQDTADRRRALTRLSPTGEELVTRLRAGGAEKLKAEVAGWLSQLDAEHLHALATGLGALAQIATSDAHAHQNTPLSAGA